MKLIILAAVAGCALYKGFGWLLNAYEEERNSRTEVIKYTRV